MALPGPRVRRRLAVLAAIPLIVAGLPAASAGAAPDDMPIASAVSNTGAELVKVVVPDQNGVLDLIAAGADVTEYAKPVAGGVEPSRTARSWCRWQRTVQAS